jgi:hypothetical protein
MKIAIFIEEQSSREPIKIIIHKILGEQTGIVDRVVKRGNLLNEEKVEAYIKKDILLDHPDVSKFVVCVDTECEDIEERTNRIEKSLNPKIRRPVYYIKVVHAFEGWLLSDPDCIKEYLGPRAKKIKILPSASKNCKPKKVMKDIFRKADKEYIHTLHNPEIAEQVNPEKMIKSNKSFKKFYDVIKDP